MLHGYSTSLQNTPPALGWPTWLPAMPAVFAMRGTGHEVHRALQVLRLICLMAVALVLAFGAVYKLLDLDGVHAIASEMALAFTGLAGLGASYRVRFVRRHFRTFVQALCFLVAFWFIAVAAANQFEPDYAVGLLFIVPGVGVGYSVSLRRVWPLAVYFILALVLTGGGFIMAAQPAIAPALFITSLMCISCVTLLVAGARLQAQNRFLDSEERYRAVVEQASDGIYLLDASTLCFLDANPAFRRMLGYRRDELQHLTFGDLVVVDRSDARGRMNHLCAGRQAHVAERKLRCKDGTNLCVELYIDRIMYGGREVLSVVARDISLRKEYEASLITAKENAEEIARFKSSLLTNMSHEIRTPLSSILGWSAVLRDEVGDNHRDLVALIEQSGKRLHNTLDAVLELAHLDANTKRLHPHVVDVAGEMADVLSGWKEASASKGLDLAFEAPSQRVWAEIDASCLRRILSHLVDNAVKFTEAGSVAVALEPDAADLRLRVRDTGVGMADTFMPHLYEEFKQESEGLARQHEGNGLGLAITRRLVDLLGGEIEVESRKGEGTCFTVVVPGAVLAGEASLVRAAVA